MKELKTYKLPAIENFAHHYIWIRSLIIIALSIVIIVPVMAVNNWNLWYLLYFSPFIVLSAVSLIKIGKWIYCRAMFDQWRTETAGTVNHAAIFAGPPGSCKSLTAVASIYEMSKQAWEEIKYERWLILNKSLNQHYTLSDDDREILDAYDFYSKNNGIPCLGANIPIYSKRYRRYCYELELNHLAQRKRLPYRINCVVDEIGTMTSVDGARKRQEGDSTVLSVADFCRFDRQFVEARLIGTEQDYKNIYIDVRRVVAENRVYKGKKEVLKPIFLTWLYKKLKVFFTNKGKISSKLFSTFMVKFNSFLKACGFLQIKYIATGNSEAGQAVTTSNKGTIYLSCRQEWVYNSRVYRSAYQCIDKPIEMSVFENKWLSKDKAEKMLRSMSSKKGIVKSQSSNQGTRVK